MEDNIRPHEKTSITYLANLGAKMYHSGYYGEYDRRLVPLQTEAQRRLGHLSVTDSVFIPKGAPDEPTTAL